MDRRSFLVGAVGVSALFLMGHSPYRKWSQYRALYTVIATDRTDAGSFPLGERLARRLARRPDLRATAARSEDARTLLSLLKTRQLDLALLRAEDAHLGLRGTGSYASLMTPLRALAGLAPEYLHVLLPASSPLRAIGDLKGESIGVVEDGGRSRLKSQRVVAAHGLDPERDVRWQRLASDDGLPAMAAGRVGALCLEAPLPAPALDAARRPAGLRLRLLPQGDAVSALAARHGPIYFRAALPADRYPDVEAGGDLLGEARLLVCREDYPLERARAIVEALAGWEELVPAGTPLPIPGHPALPAG
ncbi:MAG TPA: TAXI family TRAP transporter solute-binding subunit [Methylomirabilota bacterium]|nr:TAXI family TRAP transporter solute-binding subunit [Methylomirabilota bacterium]